MVEPGADSDEIRKAIFTEFRTSLEERSIDADVRNAILEGVLAEDPPFELSDTFIDAVSDDDET